MKRLCIIIALLLTACSENYTALATPAAPGAVCSYLATQVVLQQCNPETTTAVPATPTPTVTPSPTVAITATVAPRTPLPDGTCPATPFYAKVAPLPKDSNAWNIYIPNWPKANPYYYPATVFLQRISNAAAWTHDYELINLSSNWMAALAKFDGDSWNSLNVTSNGVFLAGKLGVTTFPGATLLITNSLYRKGECWDEVSTAKYRPNNYDILPTLPAYQLSLQTNMKYTEWPSLEVNYPNEFVPLLYQNDSAQSGPTDVRADGFVGGLWIEDLYLSY